MGLQQYHVHRFFSFLQSFSLPLVLGLLGHGVQCASVLEPLNLCLVEGLQQLHFKRLAFFGMNNHSKGLSYSKLGAGNINLHYSLVFTTLC